MEKFYRCPICKSEFSDEENENAFSEAWNCERQCQERAKKRDEKRLALLEIINNADEIGLEIAFDTGDGTVMFNHAEIKDGAVVLSEIESPF